MEKAERTLVISQDHPQLQVLKGNDKAKTYVNLIKEHFNLTETKGNYREFFNGAVVTLELQKEGRLLVTVTANDQESANAALDDATDYITFSEEDDD